LFFEEVAIHRVAYVLLQPSLDVTVFTEVVERAVERKTGIRNDSGPSLRQRFADSLLLPNIFETLHST
jgi:hypothetical protein